MYDLVGSQGVPFGLTHKKACLLLKVCSRFLKCTFFYVTIGCQALYLDVDGFPDNLFAMLLYYSEVGDVCIRVVVKFIVDVNGTGNMTAMFFQSIV